MSSAVAATAEEEVMEKLLQQRNRGKTSHRRMQTTETIGATAAAAFEFGIGGGGVIIFG